MKSRDIGAGSSPINCEGFIKATKVQGSSLLLSNANIFVRYSYIHIYIQTVCMMCIEFLVVHNQHGKDVLLTAISAIHGQGQALLSRVILAQAAAPQMQTEGRICWIWLISAIPSTMDDKVKNRCAKSVIDTSKTQLNEADTPEFHRLQVLHCYQCMKTAQLEFGHIRYIRRFNSSYFLKSRGET